MKKSLFFGGVHPAPKKELCDPTIIRLNAPERVYIPLRQHKGAECKALVKIGDAVLMGQKIGDGEGMCVPVHASVSGTVEDICERLSPDGGKVLSIVIKNDGKDESVPATPISAEGDISIEELANAVREAGIVGMGGSAFPTEVKISGAQDKIDTLIANGCECEPYIMADDVLLRTDAERFLKGFDLLKRVLKASRAVVAIEDNKPEAINAVKAELPKFEGIEVAVMPTRYPQGSEKQLIQAVTGREVPSGGLPVDAGCAVFNVATVTAIANAVFEGRPLFERVVSITGEGVSKPANYLVRVGTSFEELINASGGLKEDVVKVIAGGPMMGISQSELTVPVVKGTNCVLCLTSKACEEVTDPTCIRCGKCLEVCPIRLEPLNLYLYTGERNGDMMRALNIMDCIECGSCAYVCPGKLMLVERFREGKRLLKEGAV